MPNVIWRPQPKQQLFMSRGEDEALYGGAAGGGKSDALIIEATRQVNIPYYKGLILRKTFPQLRELIDKSLNYYPRIFPGCRYNSSSHTWKFPSGAQVIFGSMNNANDKYNYQGQAYDFIAFDELTQFTYDEYIYLVSRNRPNGPGTRCYIRATANPGGIGHGWVKERFIVAAPPMTTIWEDVEIVYPNGHREVQKKSRIFVPSSVFDNEILLQNDPSYIARLASMPEAERNALLYGDWESYSGQYFSEFKNDPAHYKDRLWTHVIEPFEIEKDWPIFRSFDWGYAKPFSAGYWTMSPDGILYRILEFYGCTKKANEGLKWHPNKVFEEIAKFESEHRWLKGKNIIGVADPAIWNAEYGESVAETASKHRVYFTPGDHERLAGWLQVHFRLAFDENGIPMMYVFKNCQAFIRTIPLLIYDEHKIEDLNTDGEDHVADEVRYMCMSRPIKPRLPSKPDEYESNPMNLYLNIPKEDLLPSHSIKRMEIYDNG